MRELNHSVNLYLNWQCEIHRSASIVRSTIDPRAPKFDKVVPSKLKARLGFPQRKFHCISPTFIWNRVRIEVIDDDLQIISRHRHFQFSIALTLNEFDQSSFIVLELLLLPSNQP